MLLAETRLLAYRTRLPNTYRRYLVHVIGDAQQRRKQQQSQQPTAAASPKAAALMVAEEVASELVASPAGGHACKQLCKALTSLPLGDVMAW